MSKSNRKLKSLLLEIRAAGSMKRFSLLPLFLGFLLLATSVDAERLLARSNTVGASFIVVDSADPNYYVRLPKFSGLDQGESIYGTAFRPSSGALFGISSLNRVYQIDLTSGLCTLVGPVNSATAYSDLEFNNSGAVLIAANATAYVPIDPATAQVTGSEIPFTYSAMDAHFGSSPNIACIMDWPSSTPNELLVVDQANSVLATLNVATGILTTRGSITQSLGYLSKCNFSARSGTNYSAISEYTNSFLLFVDTNVSAISVDSPIDLTGTSSILHQLPLRSRGIADLLAFPVEKEAPVLTANRARINSRGIARPLEISGTVTDDVLVRQVTASLIRKHRRSTLSVSVSGAVWSITIPKRALLNTGRYTLSVRAFDYSGNSSEITSVTILRN